MSETKDKVRGKQLDNCVKKLRSILMFLSNIFPLLQLWHLLSLHMCFLSLVNKF